MILLLEKVIPTTEQIGRLYEQLKKRSYNISHHTLPSLTEHSGFVENYPYRSWFLVTNGSEDIANVYVQHDNSIGFNNTDNISSDDLRSILKTITKLLTPLPAIRSVRHKGFFTNVASSNIDLQNKLLDIGCKEIQKSYILSCD